MPLPFLSWLNLRTNTSDSDEEVLEVVEKIPTRKSMLDIMTKYEDFFNDDSYIYFGSELDGSSARKKIKNAINAYANEDGYSPHGELLLLLDITLLGSAKAGIYVTDTHIYSKALFVSDPFSISIRDIEKLHLYKGRGEIEINGYDDISYCHPEVETAMKMLILCIEEYNSQY